MAGAEAEALSIPATRLDPDRLVPVGDARGRIPIGPNGVRLPAAGGRLRLRNEAGIVALDLWAGGAAELGPTSFARCRSPPRSWLSSSLIAASPRRRRRADRRSQKRGELDAHLTWAARNGPTDEIIGVTPMASVNGVSLCCESAGAGSGRDVSLDWRRRPLRGHTGAARAGGARRSRVREPLLARYGVKGSAGRGASSRLSHDPCAHGIAHGVREPVQAPDEMPLTRSLCARAAQPDGATVALCGRRSVSLGSP